MSKEDEAVKRLFLSCERLLIKLFLPKMFSNVERAKKVSKACVLFGSDVDAQAVGYARGYPHLTGERYQIDRWRRGLVNT